VLDPVLGLLLALGQVPADLPEGFASGATLRNSGVWRQQRLLILFRGLARGRCASGERNALRIEAVTVSAVPPDHRLSGVRSVPGISTVASAPVPVTIRGAACRRIHVASLMGPIAYVRGRRLPVILEIEGRGAGGLWVSLRGARGPSPTSEAGGHPLVVSRSPCSASVGTLPPLLRAFVQRPG
jgi:hypothetical protein